MAENQIQVANKKQQIKAFSDVVNNAYYQNQLQKLFGKNAGTFATSMMELYTSNADLQQCDPKLVAAEAMRAAALHLPLSKALGRAYVVVFKDHGVPKPQFIPGWRGLVDLAIRSGLYETINTRIVYKGEFLGEDKLSGFIDINGEKESNEVVGYFAYFKLVTGFRKMFFMDVKNMCHYAKVNAPTLKFNKITEDDLYVKAQEQAEHGPLAGSIGWFGDFNAMALKGLSLDTLIPTPNGFTTMGELKVGDTIYNALGEETKVIAKSEVKNLPCYKITMYNGDEIICDEEHRWFAKGGLKGGIDWYVTDTKTLAAIKGLGYPLVIPNTTPVVMRETELLADPYTLGYWLGNGHSNAGQVSCHEDDADEIANIIAKNYNVSQRHDKRTKAVTINISSATGKVSDNSSLIRQLDILKVKGNKHIPVCYKRASITQRQELLRGLCDSDGCIDKQRGRVIYSSVNEVLANDVYELVSSLGERATIRSNMANGFGKTVECFEVEWLPRTFCPFRLKRKADKFKGRKVVTNNVIKSITLIDSVPTQCIAVDSGDSMADNDFRKSFLITKSFIPTHNTVVRQLLKWGPMSIEMQQAIADDKDYQSAEEIRNEDNAAPRPKLDASQMMQEGDYTEVKEQPSNEPEPSPI